MKFFSSLPGKPIPLGTTVYTQGINFSIFSQNAKEVCLHLFAKVSDFAPSQSFILDPLKNKTGDIWHIFIEGAKKNQLYLYTMDGEKSPTLGHIFDNTNFLFDPYAKAHSTSSFSKTIPKCVVIDDGAFDWKDDRCLNYPQEYCILYETHLRGFTKDSASKVIQKGTFKGLIEKIPYLKELGITSLELLPVQEFDDADNKNINPVTSKQLTNYWGYSTISFFAPKQSYATTQEIGGCVDEFKEMVYEMHKNGIEIILDIVFNHTAEGNEKGRILNFKGIDNSIYYMPEETNKQKYKNFSGCGNTFNCNHPVVRNLIVDCLKYWVCEMHVDGFRFDLATILARDTSGEILPKAPLLEQIVEEPVLKDTKIIAEAWDAGGGYQVGSFYNGRWSEWNDKYRDDIRSFWRGDSHYISKVATRLSGSEDLYKDSGRHPFHSINFITSHDGFTLNDLVTYEKKYNQENGENNKDGHNNNISANYGYEGPSPNKNIEIIRSQQIKNFIGTLFLSQGTPMLLAGDEFRNTQKGNNNCYCQDNETAWINWNKKEENEDTFVFTKKMIAFRKKHPALSRTSFFKGEDLSKNNFFDITWFNENAEPLDWENNKNILAFRLDGSKAEILQENDDNDFYIILNPSQEDIFATLAEAQQGKEWIRIIDTAKPYPCDFLDETRGEKVLTNQYLVRKQSLLLFLA